MCIRDRAQRAAGHAQPPDDGDPDEGQVPDQKHHGHHQARDELRTECGVVQALIGRLHARDDLAAPTEDRHQLVAREGLLDRAVEVPGLRPLSDELPLAALADQGGRDDRRRDRHQRDYREQGLSLIHI